MIYDLLLSFYCTKLIGYIKHYHIGPILMLFYFTNIMVKHYIGLILCFFYTYSMLFYFTDIMVKHYHIISILYAFLLSRYYGLYIFMYISMSLYIIITIMFWVLSIYLFIKHYIIVILFWPVINWPC